jgi:hypothetical protein
MERSGAQWSSEIPKVHGFVLGALSVHYSLQIRHFSANESKLNY